MIMENLSWEITAREKKERTQKLIFRVWFPFIILGIVAATIGYPALFTYHFLTKGWIYILRQIFYTMIGVIGSFLLLLLINKLIPYKERTYFLDNNGIIISKGKKKKQYLWNEFEYFYPYSKRYIPEPPRDLPQLHPQDSIGGPEREKIFSAEQQIVGEIFYLKKKPKNIFSRLYKSFVAIYSEPNNTRAINKFLSNYLQRRTMKATSDLGLIFYEFK